MITYNHMELLLRLEPRGVLDTAGGPLVRAELGVLGGALDDLWTQRDELLEEVWPSTVEDTLSAWEEDFEILSTGGKSTAERRAAIAARLRAFPDFRPTTLAEVLTELCGYAVTIVEAFSFRCDDEDSLCDDEDDVADGAFLFFVDVDAEVAADAAVTRDELQYNTDLLKPAHTQGSVRGTSFFMTDDPWSHTDLDTIGE